MLQRSYALGEWVMHFALHFAHQYADCDYSALKAVAN
jgi:hypothetical protein